ncbi:MAG: hypothetical protein L0215_18925 [Gemmataceae bacterium]|nr:hypothetical protein [Gemmataceae bacterium]
MTAQCAHCGNFIPADKDNRLPPWCPKCGNDLKKNSAAPASAPLTSVPLAGRRPEESATEIVPHDPSAGVTAVRPKQLDRWRFQLNWTEPDISKGAFDPEATRPQAQPAVGKEESLHDVVQRVSYSHKSQRKDSRKNRLSGVMLLLFGIIVIVVGLGLSNLLTHDDGESTRTYLPMGVLGLGLVATLGGAYGMLTGTKSVEVNASIPFEVSIGPNGISRTSANDFAVSWAIPWDIVKRVEYIEHFPLGDRAHNVLFVHTKNGERETVVLAPELAPQRLADVMEAHGHKMEVAQAGDWSRK